MAQGWRICPDAKSVLCTSGPESNGMTVPGLYGGPYPIGPRAHIIADNVRIPRAGGTRKASTRGGRLDTASKQNVLRRAEEQNVKFIRLWFTDILGTLKSFAITIGELEDALDDGMGFDGSSITGYQDIEESDMIASPDPATFQVIPWSARARWDSTTISSARSWSTSTSGARAVLSRSTTARTSTSPRWTPRRL